LAGLVYPVVEFRSGCFFVQLVVSEHCFLSVLHVICHSMCKQKADRNFTTGFSGKTRASSRKQEAQRQCFRRPRYTERYWSDDQFRLVSSVV